MSESICDREVLETLDTLPVPVTAETVAFRVVDFWDDAPKDSAARLLAVKAALKRLQETGYVAKTGTPFAGNKWAITTAGRNTSRNA